MPQSRRIETALLAVTAALVALALIPTMVGLSPTIYWDVDPRSDAGQMVTQSLGPAGMVWWSVLCVALTAAALALHRAAGGAICRVSTVLVGIGMAAAAWHMPQHMANLLHGAAWIGAAAVALAVVHLAQHDKPRKLIIAALVAIIIPQAIDSAMFIYREQPMTVKHFFQNEDAFLQSRGWQRGSAAHELYLRRLQSPDAIGAFGLSNVYGSIIAAMTLLSATLAVNPLRRKQWKAGLVFAVPAALGLFTLAHTHSKGALVALMAAAGLLLAAWKLRRLLAPAAVALVVLAFVAVLARGAMGPPDTHEGERSILFRYHYWQGAARAYAAAPLAGKLLGIGPAGFRNAYFAAKPEINPEDVDSTHNVVVDYTVMLGVGGIAWVALLVWWLWRSARRAAATGDDDEPAPDNLLVDLDDGDVLCVLAIVAVVVGLHMYIEWGSLLPETFAAKAAGAIAFLGLGAVMLSKGMIGRRSAAVGLAVMSALVLIHAQIEMTFFRDGSVMLVWLMSAVAAAQPRPDDAQPPARLRPSHMLLLVAVAAIAVALAVMAAAPLSRHQAALRRASLALQDGRMRDAYDDLGKAASILPIDPDPRHWQAKLLVESAYAARAHGEPDKAAALLRRALEVAAASPDRLQALRAESRIRGQLGTWLDDKAELDRAIAAGREALKLTPYSLESWLDLAELQWRAGRRDDARQSYRQASKVSEQSYLDPAKQFNDDQRALVEQRLADPTP